MSQLIRTKKITLDDLDRLDNGSFERMLQETRAIAKDESEVEYLVRVRIIEGLARRALKERMGLPTFPLDFDGITKKPRTPVVRKFRKIQPYIKEEEEAKLVKQENQGRRKTKKRNALVEDEEEKQMPKKKKKKKSVSNNVNLAELGFPEPPELPANLREEVGKRGGNNLMMVIRKYLYATDLNKHNARFSIPELKIENPEFLSEEEKELLKEKEGNNMKGLNVTMIDPSLDECNLVLKKWPMNNSFTYTLISGWTKVSEKNNLRVNDIVELWSFRCENKLWLLLHKVIIPRPNRVDGSSSSGLVSSPSSSITDHEPQDLSTVLMEGR